MEELQQIHPAIYWSHRELVISHVSISSAQWIPQNLELWLLWVNLGLQSNTLHLCNKRDQNPNREELENTHLHFNINQSFCIKITRNSRTRIFRVIPTPYLGSFSVRLAGIVSYNFFDKSGRIFQVSAYVAIIFSALTSVTGPYPLVTHIVHMHTRHSRMLFRQT